MSKKNEKKLKELFPEAFESEVKELKIGTWYKSKLTPTTIINCQVFTENVKSGYGFHMDLWSEKWGLLNFKDYVEATEQEVFEALYHNTKDLFKCNGDEFEYEEILFGALNGKYGLRDRVGNVIFCEGVWADVLETITLSEAEQQLKKKIIV